MVEDTQATRLLVVVVGAGLGLWGKSRSNCLSLSRTQCRPVGMTEQQTRKQRCEGAIAGQYCLSRSCTCPTSDSSDALPYAAKPSTPSTTFLAYHSLSRPATRETQRAKASMLFVTCTEDTRWTHHLLVSAVQAIVHQQQARSNHGMPTLAMSCMCWQGHALRKLATERLPRKAGNGHQHAFFALDGGAGVFSLS
jgi:hypothetical protein